MGAKELLLVSSSVLYPLTLCSCRLFEPQMEALEDQEPIEAPPDQVVSAEDSRRAESSTALQPLRFKDLLEAQWGQIAYKYFSWRKVTD